MKIQLQQAQNAKTAQQALIEAAGKNISSAQTALTNATTVVKNTPIPLISADGPSLTPAQIAAGGPQLTNSNPASSLALAIAAVANATQTVSAAVQPAPATNGTAAPIGRLGTAQQIANAPSGLSPSASPGGSPASVAELKALVSQYEGYVKSATNPVTASGYQQNIDALNAQIAAASSAGPASQPQAAMGPSVGTPLPVGTSPPSITAPPAALQQAVANDQKALNDIQAKSNAASAAAAAKGQNADLSAFTSQYQAAQSKLAADQSALSASQSPAPSANPAAAAPVLPGATANNGITPSSANPAGGGAPVGVATAIAPPPPSPLAGMTPAAIAQFAQVGDTVLAGLAKEQAKYPPGSQQYVGIGNDIATVKAQVEAAKKSPYASVATTSPAPTAAVVSPPVSGSPTAKAATVTPTVTPSVALAKSRLHPRRRRPILRPRISLAS